MIDNFYVVSVISNPRRYASRYRLYQNFKAEMEKAEVNLFTAEIAFGERNFEVTTADNPMNLQLRSEEEIWHKENLINLAVTKLPKDWKYLAWVDADISFIRPDWPIETVHALQHYNVVQMWQTAIDLGPNSEVFATYTSFGEVKRQGAEMFPGRKAYYTYPHPGFAWAMRRDVFVKMGGLLDKAILGSADHHMCWAMLGRGLETVSPSLHPNYKNMVSNWQDRAIKYIDYDVGVVPGSIYHHWHGKKRDRRYTERWRILYENQFDPYADIVRDEQGLYRLTGNKPKLRDACQNYFASRNEDSIDLA